MDSTLRITRDADNIATIWIDLPGKSVNTITPQVHADLEAALTEMAHQAPAGVIFASAKKGSFVAGADLPLDHIGVLIDIAVGVWWDQAVRVDRMLDDRECATGLTSEDLEENANASLLKRLSPVLTGLDR